MRPILCALLVAACAAFRDARPTAPACFMLTVHNTAPFDVDVSAPTKHKFVAHAYAQADQSVWIGVDLIDDDRKLRLDLWEGNEVLHMPALPVVCEGQNIALNIEARSL